MKELDSLNQFKGKKNKEGERKGESAYSVKRGSVTTYITTMVGGSSQERVLRLIKRGG